MHTRDQLQNLIGEDYRLQWIIGHGGMSTVWLADDVRHEREVAIKVLRPEFTNNEEFLGRFRNEAVAAEGIHSDNVVATYDYREAAEEAGHTTCFIVMEYVRGESLADLLAREGQLREDLALDVLEQAAHGLSVLHREGLIHRDVKPGNLLVTQNGQVKITDFGIAKAAEAVPLTRTGMVVGTAQYVSPEQAQGLEVGAASDVYSLGVVGYEMLAGSRPFTGDTGISVALSHVNDAPPPLPTSVSAPARELIGISLRKDPATRFADGNEMALAVSAVRLGQRPPQPASAAMQQVAREPSPTASTAMLGSVAKPTTTHPATESRGPRTPTPKVIPAVRKQRSGGGIAAGLVIALLLAGAIAAAVWAASTGVFGGSTTPTTPTTTAEPEVVTEWVTSTQEAPEPVQPAPPQVTTVYSPPPAPEPTVPTTQPEQPTPETPVEETQQSPQNTPPAATQQSPQNTPDSQASPPSVSAPATPVATDQGGPNESLG
ncbi:serine/threonine-protein kinase [Corynebacterium guangdongense]|uniref:non-specific serine/threonine protein kinase n=1 Tax=Corynebacterium guangdongense TaxID=1783348 RepID=A0ABU2A0C7_9CORY|nr:serine/threonine-protein kinase [Corynebacterium guangdongense]MDR7330630.1 serine/threonine-protein kinase [Corynebacterium guangdongense]WJZ16646.1 Serine/threonine-protein kinase PknA [Corynebacterium guangdongense]